MLANMATKQPHPSPQPSKRKQTHDEAPRPTKKVEKVHKVEPKEQWDSGPPPIKKN